MMTLHHSTNNGVSTACGKSCSGIQATKLWPGVTCRDCLRTAGQLQAPRSVRVDANNMTIDDHMRYRAPPKPITEQGPTHMPPRPFMVSDATSEQQKAAAAVDMTDHNERLRLLRLRDFALRNPSGPGYIDAPAAVRETWLSVTETATIGKDGLPYVEATVAGVSCGKGYESDGALIAEPSETQQYYSCCDGSGCSVCGHDPRDVR